MIKLKLFFSILLLTSCSYLVSTYEKDILVEENIQPKVQTEETTCKIIQKNILINNNEKSQQIFTKFIQNVSRDYRLKFIDKVVLWSLLQINLRPDLNSPTAKLQIVLQLGNKERYFNSYVDSSKAYPYFYLLENLLREYKSRYSLIELSKLYDQNIKTSFEVSEEFADFLSKNKASLLNKPIFEKFYLRGDETLKKSERLPRIRLSKFVYHYLKTKKKFKYQIKEFLFSYNSNTAFVPRCNFDMNLYDNSIFLINKDKVKGNIFGLKSGKNAFMGISSQRIFTLKPLLNSPIFEGLSNTRSASLCLFKDRFNPSNNTWLVSSDSRDPGQHLYHLLKYGLPEVKKLDELDNMLKFSRHLFLKNPVRLVIESRRSDQKQIDELLKLNIPVYNAKNLGKIWGYLKTSKQSSFILDSRKQGVLSCNSN